MRDFQGEILLTVSKFRNSDGDTVVQHLPNGTGIDYSAVEGGNNPEALGRLTAHYYEIRAGVIITAIFPQVFAMHKVAFAVYGKVLSIDYPSREQISGHLCAGNQTIHHAQDRGNICIPNRESYHATSHICSLLLIDKQEAWQ